MSPAQTREALSALMGAVVATYNLPDVKQSLRFPGKVLAGVYLGKIAKWNDPAIEINNPGADLPDLPITIVHRGDGSGTTFIWTDYLSKVSGDWRGKGGPGAGNSIKWPVGVPAALVENRAGAFVAPSLKSVTAAAANKLKDVPADLRYTLTYADGKESYPISGTTWAVVYKKQLGANRALREFLLWAVHEGQSHVAELKYAPLPPELVAKIDALLK
jgi:phosphate transport system substrate-binding protein